MTINIKTDYKEYENNSKVTDPINNIVKRLEVLGEQAQNSHDLETILNNAIKSLFLSLPEGKKKYSGMKNLEFGIKIHNKNISNIYNIECSYNKGAATFRDKIGEINIKKKTYIMDGAYPGLRLLKDTCKVMEMLGLRKQK